MSAIRQVNWLGQQRVDVFHVRALDSSVSADFDCLAGMIYAGSQPLIVTGMTIPTTGVLGQPAANLVLRTAGAVLMHPTATDSGTIFFIDADAADEALNSTNAKVTGAFAASATNYVGIDLVREADVSTSDLTKFLDPNTTDEIGAEVPVGRVLQLKILISTLPFSSTSNILPIAKVVTDSSGNIISITDARNMMPRLGTGGDSPNATAPYSWPDASRRENPITYSSLSLLDPFAGGDKGISSFKSLVNALEHVLWEAKSGQAWYSRTTRDGTKLAMGSTVFANGDNFIWTPGTNTLDWTGLAMLFENSSGGFKNTITNGSSVILDGQCLYVDIDRTTSPSPSITMQLGTLTSLSAPTVPGSRFIIAWRNGADVHIRDRPFEVTRLTSVFALSAKRYPNVFVSANVGEGDTTSLATAITLLPAYGGVLIIMSDLTISASVTIPANVKVLARRGVTLTLSGATTNLILSDRVVIEDLRISSTKTTANNFVQADGFKTSLRNCRFDINPAGVSIGLQINGNACSVHTCEFTGVVAPSTGTGISTAVTAQDFYIAADNVFSQ